MAAFDINDTRSIRKAIKRMSQAFEIFRDAYSLLNLFAKHITR